MLSLRRNSTGPANMIRETLHAPEGANTLAASGCLDSLNKILLALYFQDLKLCKKTDCIHVFILFTRQSLTSIYVISKMT